VTTLEAPAPAASAEVEGGHSLAEPADRGVIDIAPVVFEKLAMQAASEVPGVVGEVRTGVQRLLPWASGSPADANAELGDDDVALDLTFNVAYPEPVRRVADEVRRHVAERVQSLTGRTVRSINVTVPELATAPVRRQPRRAVR
jgi:uncharacterized alkaline shock family protein YloU